MKEIILTQGKVALVDDEDFEYLNQWKWYANKRHGIYYATRGKWNGKNMDRVHMHRVVMSASDPKLFIDHKDRDGLNNQKSNLRFATRSQNGANRKKRATTSSRYMGVFMSSNKKTWTSSITHNKKSIRIGTFHDEASAALAYNKKALELHGEFARLNDVENFCQPQPYPII